MDVSSWCAAQDSIEHVIELMLENRPFDHLLAYSGIPELTGVDTSRPPREGRHRRDE
jgi:phospholipase C